MKLGTKLLLAPLLAAGFVLGVSALNAGLMNHEATANRTVVKERLAGVQTLAGAQAEAGRLHAGVYRTVTLIASLDDAKVKAVRAALTRELAQVGQTISSVAGGAEADAELAKHAQQASAQLASYLKQADQAIDLSSVDPNTGVAAMQGADATFSALAGTLKAMAARTDALAAETLAASEVRARRNNLLLGLLALLVSGGAVGAAWLVQRKVIVELQRAVAVTEQVAGGRLDVDASSARVDEVGDLMRALASMAGQLNATLGSVMQASESIRIASAEIATGNQDLSQRTEQTASNLQQTASSMEQLTGTVKQSAVSAHHANQLAASAAEVAARGGSVVSQVVATMDDIHASSRRIADIIGVIDGIAFQTNILALNAAVEAARAGEQGRGFAVVASEVRNLAQRSANAAREIKELIGASVAKVDSGSRLVADAGETMQAIVGSVQRVSDIIAEITAAAAEQSDGIGQVTGAVTELDHMTQQNAALVEQSAAAAESLREQAARLAGVVGAFQLGAARA